MTGPIVGERVLLALEDHHPSFPFLFFLGYMINPLALEINSRHPIPREESLMLISLDYVPDMSLPSELRTSEHKGQNTHGQFIPVLLAPS